MPCDRMHVVSNHLQREGLLASKEGEEGGVEGRGRRQSSRGGALLEIGG